MNDTDSMSLDEADVPDLVGALADRLESYGFLPRQSLIIAVDMLAEVLADQQSDPEAVH